MDANKTKRIECYEVFEISAGSSNFSGEKQYDNTPYL